MLKLISFGCGCFRTGKKSQNSRGRFFSVSSKKMSSKYTVEQRGSLHNLDYRLYFRKLLNLFRIDIVLFVEH